MQRANCRQVHAQQVGKLNSCHHASVQCDHVSGSTNMAAPAPAESAPATLVDGVGAKACWCAKMLNPNSCRDVANAAPALTRISAQACCWQSLGKVRPRCGQRCRCSCVCELFSAGPVIYKIQKLILAFAADRPKLADFQGACEDIDDSWWMGKVCGMGGLRARKLTTTRSH